MRSTAESRSPAADRHEQQRQRHRRDGDRQRHLSDDPGDAQERKEKRSASDCDAGLRRSSADAQAIGSGYLGGAAVGDLVSAQQQATADTLAKRGRPVRVISMKTLDERAMGALFMHLMLETIAMGRLMGVDPFDQPAVEEGKVLARKYLEGGA